MHSILIIVMFLSKAHTKRTLSPSTNGINIFRVGDDIINSAFYSPKTVDEWHTPNCFLIAIQCNAIIKTKRIALMRD